MVARRIPAALALLLLAVVCGAGCAQSITGSGTLAEGAVQPAPASEPGTGGAPATSAPAEPTEPAEETPQADGEAGPVCAALEKPKVEKAFGSSVQLVRSQSTGCLITVSDGRSMIVAVFDALDLSTYKRGQFTELEVSGYPAIRTSSNIIYVAQSRAANASGLLAAYFSGLGENGDSIAATVIALLLEEYAK